MKTRSERNVSVRFALACVLACVLAGACGSDTVMSTPTLQASAARSPRADAQAIATWNELALKTTAGAPLNPPRETRALALVSIAVFDAVNAIERTYEPFAVRVTPYRGGSSDAAAAAAAHHVLVTLYPSAAAMLDAAYDSALATLPRGRPRDEGVTTGETVAATVLAMRASDHALDPSVYASQPALGTWVPAPAGFVAALEPGWGKVTPFLLASGAQFRPGPPPAPGSDAYVRDYVEILSLGASTSAARTDFQTETARFWIATAPQLWNQVVRQLTTARGMDAAMAARAYLALNVAGADAIIAAWDAKYAYGQWRPVTAIRWAGDDGSAATTPDAAWTPLLTTPPFPDYPAGHTSFGGAAEQVLSALFGETPGDLAITSATAGGVTHHYQSFHAIAAEVVDARVWGGVHWRTSVVAGRELGRRVGDLARTRLPSP